MFRTSKYAVQCARMRTASVPTRNLASLAGTSQDASQTRCFHSVSAQRFLWKRQEDSLPEDSNNIHESNAIGLKNKATAVSLGAGAGAVAGSEVGNTTLAAEAAAGAIDSKSMDLDEILRKDELKSIYQDLDFNDEGSSILSYLDPTSYLAGCCELLHNIGMPWWSAIAFTGVLIRLAASPLTVLNMRFTATTSHHQEMMKHFNQKKMELRRKNQKDKLQKVMKDEKKYRKEHGIELWKGFTYSGLQIPFFIAMFFSARHLLDLDLYPDMIEGGALWFKNLAEPSSFWGLPLFTGVVQIANSELQQRFGQMRQSLEQQHELVQLAVRWGIRGVMLFAVWWMSGFESVYFCIWLPGALFQLLLTIIQITPQGRRLFKIPEPYLPNRPAIMKKKTGIAKFLDKLTPARLATETVKEKPKLLSQGQKRSKKK